MSLEALLIVSAILFSIGLYGTLARSNVIAVLMSLEIMFNAVNLTLGGPGQVRSSPGFAG